MKCDVAGCVGVDFEEAVIRDILLAGIRTEETRRAVLATKFIHRMPVDLIIDLVQSQESAREDAMFKPPGQMSAQAASVTGYRRKQRNKQGEKPQLEEKQTSGKKDPKRKPPKIDPQEKTCECGNKFFDFVAFKNGGFNQKPYVMCRDCAVSKPRPRTR